MYIILAFDHFYFRMCHFDFFFCIQKQKNGTVPNLRAQQTVIHMLIFCVYLIHIKIGRTIRYKNKYCVANRSRECFSYKMFIY